MTHSPTQTEPSDSSSWVEPLIVDPNGAYDNEVWETLFACLQRACKGRPGMDAGLLFREASLGDAVLWALVDEDAQRAVGCIATQAVAYQTGYQVLLVKACGLAEGVRVDDRNMKHVIRKLETAAIAQGLDAIRIEGRKGWGRVLDGYSEISRVIEKPLLKVVH